MESCCELPRDLLIEILARLSVKTLMRFKCVCRFFYELIKKDDDFMDKHYEFSRAKNNCALLELNSRKFPVNGLIYYLLYKESESETRCIYLDMSNSEIKYIKSCHGVLCLIVGKGYPSASAVGGDTKRMPSPGMIFDVFALNPSTREIKALPSIKVPNRPPNKGPIEYYLHIMFGFGLSKNMVWKIVMLLRFEDINLREDGHEIVMVCSQVGDSWNWRQIDAVPNAPMRRPLFNYTRDLYLKGKYYWACYSNMEMVTLIWFDMDDEIFGKIVIPEHCNTDFITIMNDTIASISFAEFVGDDGCFITIWLMDENNNNITWRQLSSIHSDWGGIHADIPLYGWTPVGIWNLGGQLLVFSSDTKSRYNNEIVFSDGSGPYLISIDLVTQEMKIICTREVKKSAINIGMNLAGNAQIVSERNITKDEEWNITKDEEWSESNILWFYDYFKPYARDFHESLKFL